MDRLATSSSINELSNRIRPDNIEFPAPQVIEENGIIISLINPNSSISISGTSVCAGYMINPDSRWGEPLNPVPNGSFALFRSNNNMLELATDMVASRTIWYLDTGKMFLASTSQRAIVFYLQSFEPNPTAFSWMLATGNLGPGNSWDRRIKSLPPDTTLLLDRRSWNITYKTNELRFDYSRPLAEKEYEIKLGEAIENTFTNLKLDSSRWVLPLSGGFDSREILMNIKDKEHLTSITWGSSSAKNERYNDAYIAQEVADYFHVSHRYFELDKFDEPLETIFNRFIIVGEGRVDTISGYFDGFAIWKWIFENNFLGVIRGDQVFGWLNQGNESAVRGSIGAMVMQDYSNLQIFRELFEKQFTKQRWPAQLTRENGEPLLTWRDRLDQHYRIPVIMAASNELKCSFGEVVTPYLNHNIVRLIRKMPDKLRTDKFLFRKIVIKNTPKIPFAKYPAIPHRVDIFREKESQSLFFDVLSSSSYRASFSNDLIDHVLARLNTKKLNVQKRNQSLKTVAKRLLPFHIKKIIRDSIYKPAIDYNIIAFRIYLAGKVNEMFTEDSKKYKPYSGS